jgi:PKD repeat protein
MKRCIRAGSLRAHRGWTDFGVGTAATTAAISAAIFLRGGRRWTATAAARLWSLAPASARIAGAFASEVKPAGVLAMGDTGSAPLNSPTSAPRRLSARRAAGSKRGVRVNGARSETCVLEAMEDRRLFSAGSAALGSMTLSLQASNTQKSSIVVTANPTKSTFTATVDGKSVTAPLSSLGYIKFFGTAIGAYVWIDPNITVPENLANYNNGSDTIYAGGGTVTLRAGNGSDVIFGGLGRDTIQGGSGNCTITAGSGGDSISAGTGNDSITAGTGADTINGGKGQSTVIGGSAVDLISNAANLPSVDVYTVAPLNSVISNWFSDTLIAGQTLQVNAANSGLGSGDPLSATYAWNFGDAGGSYDTLTGFNAAHVYNTPGAYTVSLTITNSLGQKSVATQLVTVVADTRRTIFVSNAGSDSNNGLSASSPVQTLARAMQLQSANTRIFLARGQTFDVSGGLTLNQSNEVLGAYGTGADPIIKYDGPRNSTAIVTTSGLASNITIENITFDTIYSYDSAETGMGDAVDVFTPDTSVIGCTFLNVENGIYGSYWGLLAQNDSAPVQSDLRAYFLWLNGTDIVALGNNVAGSAQQHDIRGTGDRVLIADNTLANPATVAGTPGKTVLDLQGGEYFTVANNVAPDTGGGVWLGPLQNQSQNPSISWVNFTGNQMGAYFDVEPGAHHVALQNNVFLRGNVITGLNGISINGYESSNGRQVVDLRVLNNTDDSTLPEGTFLSEYSPAAQITVDNNLWLAPNLGGYGWYRSAALVVAGTNLTSFTQIKDNVWPQANFNLTGQGNVYYVSTQTQASNGWFNIQAQLGSLVIGNELMSPVLSGAYGLWTNGIYAGAIL